MKLKSIELVRAMPPKPRTPPGLPLVARNYGVVTAISYGPPLTVTLTLGGSSVPIAGVPCLSSYTPKVGDMVAVDHGESVLMVLGSTNGTAQGYGLLGHAEAPIGTTGSITTTPVALNGLSLTVPVAASRLIVVTVKTRLTSTINDDPMTLYFLRDGVIFEADDWAHQPGVAEARISEVHDPAPAAGSHTYSAKAVRGSSGTGILSNTVSATKRSSIRIEDKGAN